jgi:hypothetical protein
MPQLRWQAADLLDLEFFLHQDEGEDMARLAARDRNIYAALPETENMADAELLRSWLAYRKQAEEKKNIALPGSLWRELMFIAFGAIVLAGLSSGVGLALSVLAYSGSEPINVAVYFAAFVLLQLILFLFLASSLLCSKLQGGSILTTSLLYRLAGWIFSWLLEKFMAAAQRRAVSKIPRQTRLHWSAQIGTFKNFQQRHGLFLLRHLFLLAQMFGISFNIGALAVTLFKVIGSDMAFGWQSTLQISSESVHALVRWISLPWAWFAATCVPSPEQIEGSRLILKDGIYHLASRDLASWWPFLCLSVFCYGLLPRLFLLITGMVRQRRELAALDFRQACFRQIIHRLRTPLVSTAAPAEKQVTATLRPAQDDFFQPVANAASSILALIPEELSTAFPFTALQEQIRRRAGYQLCQTVPFWTLDKSEEEELAIFHSAMEAQGCADLLIVHEAWQPPVQELLAWLALLRRHIGPQSVIILALIGKPAADTILTPTQPEHLRIWRQKLAAFSDSGLHLIELVDHAESHS